MSTPQFFQRIIKRIPTQNFTKPIRIEGLNRKNGGEKVRVLHEHKLHLEAKLPSETVNSPVGHVYQDTCKLSAHLNIHEINIVTNNLLSADSMLGLDDIIIPGSFQPL
ncbi:hypothetical protein FRX31_006948 [Thalictrum thalictroides]|uniref:Uncharacterized protein n=1 Tax=Thalictrum thalictroides TaxID=46969 RepID=A0A7J6X3T8_THATH|nr:hypothetical protein FRX31_006948 [Thalictrum thalictroides]